MAERKKQSEPAGNTIAAQVAFERELMRFAQVFYRSDYLLERLFEGDVWVKRISVTMPNDERSEYMAVCSAVVGGEWMVAFQGGSTMGEALKGLLERMENGSVKWRPDKFKSQ